MVAQYLLDSNTVIDYLADRLSQKGTMLVDECVNKQAKISVMTEIEVQSKPVMTAAEEQLLADFCNDAEVISITGAAIRQTILLRRQYRLKTPDAVIAATAIIHGLTLISRNVKDFGKIAGLSLINPFAI